MILGSTPDASVVHPVGRRRARVAFMEQGSIRATALALSIVLVRADVPEVLTEGLVARLLLGVERCGVRGDRAQVLLTLLHGTTDSAEACACQGLVARYGSAACHALDATQIQTAAIRARGRSSAVGCQQHLLVTGVRRLLVDFRQCTTYGTDTRCPYYFCHCLSSMLYFRPTWKG